MGCPCSKYCNGFDVKESNSHRQCKISSSTVPSHMGWNWRQNSDVSNSISFTIIIYSKKKMLYR